MIVRLELAPGDVLNESELMADLGIGRTPIREAVQRLRRDQLVTILPRRGVFVTSVDIDDLPMLFSSRAVIEPHLAELASLRGSDSQWDEIEAVLDNANDPDTQADVEAMLEADYHCHRIMWEAADNRFLTATADMLYAQSNRLWHLYLSEIGDMSAAVAEHQQILDALRAADVAKAAELTEHHIRAFEREIRERMHQRLESQLEAR